MRLSVLNKLVSRKHCLNLFVFLASFLIFLIPVSAITYVNNCITITVSGEYILNQSILNNNSIACINISSSDVIFDGNGSTIDGIGSADTYGVYVSYSTALTNITIKNLNVTDWHYGIYYQNVSNGSIANNTIQSSQYALYLNSSTFNNITYNNASSNNNTIYLASSSYNNFSSNALYTPREFTDVVIADNDTKNNSFWSNEFYGNGVNDTFGNNIYNVSGAGNYYSCNAEYIPATDPDFYRVVIDDCYVNQNLTLLNRTYYISDASNGVIIINASNVALNCNNASLVGNSSFPNFSGIGIYANRKYNITISNCNIYNYSSGIQINISNNVSITGSTINSNLFGIRLYPGAYNISIANNTLRFNFFGVILSVLEEWILLL